MSRLIHGFPPIIDHHSRLLILGSIPGDTSLQKSEYYGHPRNQFWRIMGALLREDVPLHYPDRLQWLLRREIALWDVLQGCQRIGSLDSRIRQPVPNDFATLFRTYPRLEAVFCNGRKAFDAYRRFVPQSPRKSFYLPSSSPAHARSLDEKVCLWRIVPQMLSEGSP